MIDETPPELAGDDRDEPRPVRRPMMQRLMRIVIVIGVLALVVPGVLATLGTQLRTAETACRVVVQTLDRTAVASVAHFELLGVEGPGWYCSSRQADGRETLLRPLGLIPGMPELRSPGIPA